MTIVAAIQAENGTWIGSDTLLAQGSRKILCHEKWYTYRNWGIALAGDWRVSNLINQNKELLLSKLKDQNDFIDRLFKLFEEKEIGRQDTDYVKSFGQNLLLAKKDGSIYEIDCELSFVEIPFNTIIASGSGRDYALGAAFAVNPKASAEDKLKICIEAAMNNTVDCGGECWIKKL